MGVADPRLPQSSLLRAGQTGQTQPHLLWASYGVSVWIQGLSLVTALLLLYHGEVATDFLILSHSKLVGHAHMFVQFPPCKWANT